MGSRSAGLFSRALAGLLALGIGSAGSLHAAEPPAPGEPPAIEWGLPTIHDLNPEKIEEAHEEQVRYLQDFVDRLDRVFGEHYLEDRDRKILVRAGVETTFNDEGTSTDTGLRLGLRVPLPALERRLNIFVNIGEDLNELGAVSSPNFSGSDKVFSLAAGVLRRYRDNLEGGIKVKLFRQSGSVFSVYPFVRFEDHYDSWRAFLEQQVIWESDNSWSTLTELDVDRRFHSGLFLRLQNRVDYSFEEPGASVAHGLILRREAFEKSGLSFELWLEYNTAADDPETLADDTIAYAQLRLRGRVWHDWLEYELRPIYTVPVGTDRDPFFGFHVGFAVLWESFLGGAEVGK